MTDCCRALLDGHKARHRPCHSGCTLECRCGIEWINDTGAWCKAFTLSAARRAKLRARADLIAILAKPR